MSSCWLPLASASSFASSSSSRVGLHMQVQCRCLVATAALLLLSRAAATSGIAATPAVLMSVPPSSSGVGGSPVVRAETTSLVRRQQPLAVESHTSSGTAKEIQAVHTVPLTPMEQEAAKLQQEIQASQATKAAEATMAAGQAQTAETETKAQADNVSATLATRQGQSAQPGGAGSQKHKGQSIQTKAQPSTLPQRQSASSPGTTSDTTVDLVDAKPLYNPLRFNKLLSTGIDTMLKMNDQDGVEYQGAVKVGTPIVDETTQDMAEEKNRACIQEFTITECMSRLGSYGIRRLFTYPYEWVEFYGWQRPNWMAHPVVQGRPYLSVTQPMSHASSAFEVFGEFYGDLGRSQSASVLKQTYDIYQQLMLGVRALDLPVAVNTASHHLYAANGDLTVSLVRIFSDIDSFLATHPKEVITLDLRIAKLWDTSLFGSTQLLKEEETEATSESSNPTKLPGQMVHNLAMEYLDSYLADYTKLSFLEGEPGNPTIEALVGANARVMYFWEGQQVLCFTVGDCLEVPGWQQPKPGQPFTFGPPMRLGERAGSGHGRVIEPLCINPTEPLSKTDDPVTLLNGLKIFSRSPQNATTKHYPSCLAPNTTLPHQQHHRPLVHRLDAWLSFTAKHRLEMEEALRTEKEVWKHGEALTARSYAESVNYLLLLWYLDKGQQVIFSRVNSIATDHVHPSVVHRIVSAMQEQPECGYTIHCLDTGSCFSSDLHAGQDKCFDEFKVRRTLWAISERRWISWEARYTLFFFLWVSVKIALLFTCLSKRQSEDKEKTKEESSPGDSTKDVNGDTAGTRPDPADDDSFSPTLRESAGVGLGLSQPIRDGPPETDGSVASGAGSFPYT